MPYMAEIPINTRRRDVMALVNDTYRMHAAVMRACSDMPSTDEGRVLWHVDRRPSGKMFLYVVSPGHPDLQVLDSQLGSSDAGMPPRIKSYDEFLSSLHEGQTFKFRLVANPVFQVKKSQGKGAHQSLAHVTAEQQMVWLAGAKLFGKEAQHIEGLRGNGVARDESNGFRILCREGVLQFHITQRDPVRFRQGKSGNSVTISRVTFEGLCEVIDVQKMRHALTFGIGRGKGFGCGLLMVSPVVLGDCS